MRKFTVLFFTGILLAAGCATENSNKTANVPNINGSNMNVNKASNTENVNKSAVNDASKDTTAVKLGGNWDSDKLNIKGEEHTEFSLFITQVGDKIEGTYSVINFVAGEPQIEDGNQTPFVGTVKNGVAEIKFDPENTVPGYEENVMYVEPINGKPATATITMSGDSLTWKTTSGAVSGNVPKEIKLSKDKMNKVSEE